MTSTWKRIVTTVAVIGGLVGAAYLLVPGQIQAVGFSNFPGAGMMSGSMGDRMHGMMGGRINGQMAQMHEAMGGMHDQVHGAVAEALGLTAEELTEAVTAGQSLQELADAAGIDIAVLNETLLAAKTTALQRLVSEGALTQEQADLMIEHMAGMDFAGMHGPMGAMMQGGGCHGAPRAGQSY
jgi:hypothetical protein